MKGAGVREKGLREPRKERVMAPCSDKNTVLVSEGARSGPI